MTKIIDIRRRYSDEISEINYILQNLQVDRYYEKSGARMDGSLSTQITKLKNKFEKLLDKIEYDEKSITENNRDIVEKVEGD